MNYERIYSEFIADRRTLESALTGYTERHHILPRSLGGTDCADNLIRLTAEDHIFAHLLLAKVHGGKQWAPLIVMLQPARRVGIKCKGRRARRIAALARRKNGEAQTGKSRPDVSAKLKGRIFSPEHRARLSASRTGWKDCEATRLKKSAASTGRRWSDQSRAKLSAKRMGAANPAKRPEVRAKIAAKANNSGVNNPRHDKTVRTFIHADGRVERLTKFEMAAKHGLNRACLNYVISGERNATKGWTAPKESSSRRD